MPAMNGFAVSFRSKGRLIGCCMALVLLVTALFASTASAKPVLNPTKYVAIGDSLAFGYTQEKFELNFPTENPSAFEGGYANVFAKKLAAAEKKAGNALSLVNLGCPGEISDGMIGHNPAIGGYTYVPKEGETEAEVKRNEEREKEHNPCAYHNVNGFPLHFEHGSSSQLEAAIGVIAPAPSTVSAVTVNIGSNDELKVVAMCSNKAYLEANGFAGGVFECLTVEAGPEGHFYTGGLFHHIIANTGTVIGVLRSGLVKYAGKITILGFYNPQAFILPGSDSLQKALNEVFADQVAKGTFGPGVKYANPFPVINPQNAKQEKVKIKKFTEECNPAVQKFQTGADPGCEGDIHPTPAGYKKLGNLINNEF